MPRLATAARQCSTVSIETLPLQSRVRRSPGAERGRGRHRPRRIRVDAGEEGEAIDAEQKDDRDRHERVKTYER